MGTQNGPGTPAVYKNAADDWYTGAIGGHAAGGFIPVGGLGIVGDIPGRRTGAEELVQALPGGGARVYSNQETNNLLGSGMSTRALEQKLDTQTAALRSMQNSIESLPEMLASEIQKRR
jgi:hypothetical protein